MLSLYAFFNPKKSVRIGTRPDMTPPPLVAETSAICRMGKIGGVKEYWSVLFDRFMVKQIILVIGKYDKQCRTLHRGFPWGFLSCNNRRTVF